MSGYHRMSKLKGCLNTIKNLKNINTLTDTLGKEIEALCNKAKAVQDSTGTGLEKIKELNNLLTKEFNKATTNIKSGSGKALNFANANARTYKSKLEDTCKPLYTLSDALEEKRAQYKRKYLKSRHIRKEAEKLCTNLAKRQVYNGTIAWTAAGLSLEADKAPAAADTAAKTGGISNIDNAAFIAEEVQNQASVDLDTAVSISNSIEVAHGFESEPSIPISASVLDKLFPSFSETAHATFPDATSRVLVNNDYFVVKTGKYADQEVEAGLPTQTAAIIDEKIDHGENVKGSTDAVLDPIPEPPPIPDLSAEALNQLNALGEPTFASLGLGGWSPVGIVQNCMEYLHVSLGLEWWLAIVLATCIIRLCVFPLVILTQRNAAKMNNSLPQMQMIQMKLSEARQTGDAMNAARYSQELLLFMNEKGLNPLKNMIVPLVQAPVFISFFMGLRQMANVPVESLRTGGMLWFPDLSLPDQYFVLPIITSLTLWLTIELGTDTAKLSAQNMQIMKYVLRAVPLIMLPFTINFQGAILCYWVSSNFVSLAQVAFLRIPTVRDYFKIERMINFKPDQLPSKPKGFAEGVKDSWTNLKITRELEERRKLDEMQFRRAGKGPVQKTYKYDPTKQSSPGAQAPISAKKR